uniref:ShKT domain-containing protein n=1 Tax=Panagrolaimus sp. ES5 TaxID=591445 RepID=A0AC34G9B8_9BILA
MPGVACVVGICSGCLNGECCGPDGTGVTGTTVFGATVSSTFASFTTAPGCIGPCFDNACPAGYTCNTVSQQCCLGQTTSSPSRSCRDLIGPKGYSDCPRLAYLCNSTTYYDIMTQQCAKTCGRSIGCNAQCDSGNFPMPGVACVAGICSGCLNGECCGPDGTGVTGTTVFGATVSSTFASFTTAPGCIGPCFDNACPADYTCNTVSQQCCLGQTTSSPSRSCRDLIGPKGYSDCPRLAYLCNSTTYYDIMTQQCAKTCGRCNSFNNSTSGLTNPSSTNCKK